MRFLASLALATLVVSLPASARQTPGVWPSAPGEAPRAVAPAGDADGDGRGDYAVYEQALSGLAARVRVFSGATGSAWIDVPVPPSAAVELASVGDVDLDGHDDLALGLGGAVLTLSGADGSTLWSAALVGEPLSIASVGDRDSDGVRELLVGRTVSAGVGGVDFLSGATGGVLSSLAPPAGSTETFGCAAVEVGDLDLDGVIDLAVGDWRANAGKGVVRIIAGASGQLLSSLDAPASYPLSSGFGVALAALGDVDLDGVADLAVGAPWFSMGGPQGYEGPGVTGAVLVHSLGSGALLREIRTLGSLAFGLSLESAGDVDLDGRDDVLVGSGLVRSGCCHYSSAAAQVLSAHTGMQIFWDGEVSHGMLARVADLDGDGLAEIFAATGVSQAPGSALIPLRPWPRVRVDCSPPVQPGTCAVDLYAWGQSLSAGSGLALLGDHLADGRATRFLWSASSSVRPLGFGTLCLAAPIGASPLALASGVPGPQCSGSSWFVVPSATLATLVAPGALLHAQLWQRQPSSASSTRVTLSYAIEIPIWP
ncbi:MAG: FG-GAP repeat protein [Planctomycetes bacterium]|nr:FG-GAP repeat protein [Planctomycetota bacterium]